MLPVSQVQKWEPDLGFLVLQLLPGAEERRTEWAGDLLGDGQLVHCICSLSTCFLLYGRRQVIAG